jgi:hypothetical protein
MSCFSAAYRRMTNTLAGKEGYLFFTSDSANDLQKHCVETYPYSADTINRYARLKNFLLVIYPDKSYVLNQYLPDGFNAVFRPVFDQYYKVLGDRMIDGNAVLKDIPELFYKTDTHMNLKGCLMILNATIEYMNTHFDYNLEVQTPSVERIEVESLSALNVGIGDLTWPSNRGDLILPCTRDVYYTLTDYTHIYCTPVRDEIRILTKQMEDCTSRFGNQLITWDILSENILYQANSGKVGRVLIFFDSFTIPILPLLRTMFAEVYLVKDILSEDLIRRINPTHTLEMRVERFLF